MAMSSRSKSIMESVNDVEDDLCSDDRESARLGHRLHPLLVEAPYIDERASGQVLETV